MLIGRFKRSLKWRIAILFSGLILILFTTALFVVNEQNINNAQTTIESDLQVTVEVFRRIIDNRTQSLRDIAQPATSDHAFRQAFGGGHAPTIISAMNNIVSRLSGFNNVNMLLIDFNNEVIAASDDGFAAGSANPWPSLIERAEEHDLLEASAITFTDNQLYQVIVSPLLLPDPEAWVVLAFPIDDAFADEISKIALTDLSVYSQNNDGFLGLHASSLNDIKRQVLFEQTSSDIVNKRQTLSQHAAQGETYITLTLSLDETPDSYVGLAIYGSLDKALSPYTRLTTALIIIFGFGLAFSIAGTLIISRSITEPIKNLNDSVAAIGSGDFSARATTQRDDEIGMLSQAVNLMAEGLEEKEKVRNLLGRVVSNEVAEELLRKDIELGGEEKEVSILFSDIRNFTALSEDMRPSDVLNLLNRYFTRITNIIEAHQGVVDKYIGDEVMAVFGAPIENTEHASQAVAAATEMLLALDQFNAEIKQELGIQLEIGIGVNTGTAVAGNIGSESRMNYTLLGDTVNTASRLEGLTKQFKVPLIVSQATANAVPKLKWHALGEAEIRGKSTKVNVFTVT